MNNKKSKLNLNHEAAKMAGSNPEIDPETLKKMEQINTIIQSHGGDPNAIFTSCLIDISITLNGIEGALQNIAVDLSDIKDNYNKQAVKEGYITEMEITERENDTE